MKLAAALLFLAFAASTPAADDGFAKWWPEYKTAVAKNDPKAIVKGAQFPMDWELGKVRKIQTEVEFLADFGTYFTADMRKAIATQKPVSIPNDQYMITWHARGNEYSLYFMSRGGSWSLYALSEGPP
jgi:hypothetical protein